MQLRNRLKKILAIIALKEDTNISNKTKIDRMQKFKDGFFQELVKKMQALWSTKQINKKRKTAGQQHIKSTESKNENKLQNSSNKKQKKLMMKKEKKQIETISRIDGNKEKKLKESMSQIDGKIDQKTMWDLLRTYRDYNRYTNGISFGKGIAKSG